MKLIYYWDWEKKNKKKCIPFQMIIDWGITLKLFGPDFLDSVNLHHCPRREKKMFLFSEEKLWKPNFHQKNRGKIYVSLVETGTYFKSFIPMWNTFQLFQSTLWIEEKPKYFKLSDLFQTNNKWIYFYTLLI